MISRPRLLAVAVLAAAAAFAVERLVVTDAEAVERTLQDAAAAVTRGDWDAFAASVADDFADRGQDKGGFVAWAKDLWARSHAKSVEVDVGDVRVEGDRAAARVVVRPGAPWAGVRVPGRVDLVRAGDGWRVESVAADDTTWLRR